MSERGAPPISPTLSDPVVTGEPRTSELPSVSLIAAKISVVMGRVHWEPPPLETVAMLLPEYEVLSFLGRGGMGAIYKARQPSLKRLVAIKLLPLELGQDESFRRRFLREAETMAHLSHPRIVTLHASGDARGYLYFVMEFVEGASLHDLIQQRQLTPALALGIVREVGEALVYAHGRGVIHRDIKPANVLIDPEGRVKLTDFGLSRLIAPKSGPPAQTSGLLFGTREYAAPEQLTRSPDGGSLEADQRTDVYALGVLLYETLCHEVPRGHDRPPSQRAGVSRKIDRIVARAMQSEPERRYPTVAAFLVDLQRVAPPVAAGPAPQTFARRLAVAWSLVAAALLGSLALYREQARTHSAASLEMKPAPPAWHNWLAEREPASFGLESRAGGYLLPVTTTAQRFFPCSPPLRDQALRVTCRFMKGRVKPSLRIVVRAGADGDYYFGAAAIAHQCQIVRRDHGKPPIVLQDLPAEAGDAWQTFELRATGNLLEFFLNGVLKTKMEGSLEPRGEAAFLMNGGILLKRVEWRSLGP